MIRLQKLKQELDRDLIEISTNEFIKMHVFVEGYIKRLYFIALRLNNVKYATAEDLINKTYLKNEDLLPKVIVLITKGEYKLSDFECRNNDFKVLLNLFYKFTSKYRNLLFHGVYDKLRDMRILRYCYFVDKYFIIEFENTLRLLGYKSAFDEPKDWGATKSLNNETYDEIRTRLKLGMRTEEPFGINKVVNEMRGTKYSDLQLIN